MAHPNTTTQRPTSETPADPALPKQVPIEQVVRQTVEVSTLPHIAMRVMGVANDPNAGAADLRVVVEGDPALSARVLKCVNSAAYALRFKVTSLQRAISYLGFKQVRNLAVTASVSEVFHKDQEIKTYSRARLWRHLVSVAISSRMIAARQKMDSFEEAFLAGLLHDLGIVLEDQYCHERFVAMVTHLSPEQTLLQAEQEYLGFDHTRLGSRMADEWKFPEEVKDIMRFHHMPQNYRGPHGKTLACVVLANLLCTLKGVSSMGMNLLRPTLWSMEALGMNKNDVKVLATDLDKEFEANHALFKL